MSGFGLYLHVPFCVRKCNYCDFCSIGIGKGDSELTGRLTDCMISEMSKYDLADVNTVFIGGGTPSILPVGEMDRLLSAICMRVGSVSEFTIECNPGTVDEEKLKLYKKYGVNRISFGLQSVNDDALRMLGRIHTYSEFLDSYRLARSVGFEKINIDLMTAIPGQTKESLLHTLDEVTSLKPEHISAYSLIIEEGTPFFDKYSDEPPVDEDTDRSFFEMTHELLTEAGYEHYEVSNYAKLGYECEHNLNYWRRGNYIGIGPAAASHMDGVRKTNTKDLTEYMDSIEAGDDPAEETEVLTKEQKLTEYIYLGLRTSEGISIDDLKRDYGFDIELLFKSDIDKMINEKLAIFKENFLILTPSGWWVSDMIVSKLLDKI